LNKGAFFILAYSMIGGKSAKGPITIGLLSLIIPALSLAIYSRVFPSIF
jgi:hypothetical protein